jgi:hypothetical protein
MWCPRRHVRSGLPHRATAMSGPLATGTGTVMRILGLQGTTYSNVEGLTGFPIDGIKWAHTGST